LGGRLSLGEDFLRLWIEHAHENLNRPGQVGFDAVRTFQTEEQFFVVLVSCPQSEIEGKADQIAARVSAGLAHGTPLDSVVEATLATLAKGEHIPLSILQVFGGRKAHLVECDAPPLFLTRQGKQVLPPILEEVSHGRLLRQGEFALRDGDFLAIVSEGYIKAKGWSRRWGWRDIATSIRRLTVTGGGAEGLLGALVRMYHRLAAGDEGREVSVVAMHVRPLRSTTVWSGPPADPAQDQDALNKLMAEKGTRVICGDTTADIAARLLRTSVEMEPRPRGGWADAPPVSRVKGIDLVTEGVVTLRKARERLAGAQRVRDLPRTEDGATRLARILLEADIVHFIIGKAVNPAQTVDAAGKIPWRQVAIEELIGDLQAAEKIVSFEYM
jgi:hypothetical protein